MIVRRTRSCEPTIGQFFQQKFIHICQWVPISTLHRECCRNKILNAYISWVRSYSVFLWAYEWEVKNHVFFLLQRKEVQNRPPMIIVMPKDQKHSKRSLEKSLILTFSGVGRHALLPVCSMSGSKNYASTLIMKMKEKYCRQSTTARIIKKLKLFLNCHT